MTENSFPKTDSEMTDADKVGLSNCELDIQSEKSSKVYFKQIMEYLCNMFQTSFHSCKRSE